MINIKCENQNIVIDGNQFRVAGRYNEGKINR